MKRFLLLAFFILFSPFMADGADQGSVLMGWVVKQTADGTLIDGRVVSSAEYYRRFSTLDRNKLVWVIGWKEPNVLNNQRIEFLVTSAGKSERENAVGGKEDMEQYNFVCVVTRNLSGKD